MKNDTGKMFSPVSEIMQADPFIRFVFERKVWVLTIIFAGVAYGAFYAIFLPIINRTIEQVLGDWPELIRILAVTPLLLGYYVWQPSTIQDLYDLAIRRAPNLTADDFKQISRLTRPLRYRFWFWAAILFGGLNSVFYYRSLLDRPLDWQNSNGIIILLSTAAAFVSFYVVMQIVVRQIIIIYGINKFFRTIEIDVAPLHPDKAGGLRPLGQYVVTIGLGIGIMGLALGISLLRSYLGLETLESVFYITLGVYLVTAPAFFFIPLVEAHRLMKTAKDNILVDVAEQYQSLYLSALQKMKNGKPMDKELAQMDAVHKMFVIADASAVWPFNFNILTRFSAAVLLPVVLPLVIDYLTNVIKSFLLLLT